ncbi:MAG: galactose-1-phosphate uridylyltransferase [Patescibacteria group bacterium]
MPKNKKSEIRKDYIQDKYVIIAPHRHNRPHDTQKPTDNSPVFSDKCVFCPAHLQSEKPEFILGNKKKWDIFVLKNKFPAVSTDNPKAYGYQEVVIETPYHKRELDELSIPHIKKLLDVYAERTKVISKIPKIEYILIFKNNGGSAGASIQHTHSQIFATEFLPPHLFDKSQKTQTYKLKHGRCVYCDVIAKESQGPRLIWQDENIVCFAPYASICNYEAWILPKRHLDNVTNLNDSEKKSFAYVLKYVLQAIDKLNLPYNYYFHQVIHDEDQHLYMKIIPRGSIWAGVEIGSGLIINPVAPESAATYYRKFFTNLRS